MQFHQCGDPSSVSAPHEIPGRIVPPSSCSIWQFYHGFFLPNMIFYLFSFVKPFFLLLLYVSIWALLITTTSTLNKLLEALILFFIIAHDVPFFLFQKKFSKSLVNYRYINLNKIAKPLIQNEQKCIRQQEEDSPNQLRFMQSTLFPSGGVANSIT